jgi:predicted nucleotidyltransferase
MDLKQLRQFTTQINEIAAKHGISRVYIFGSFARGENSFQSDLDLLVEMKKGASLFGMAGFGYEIEKLLGLSVDVVPISTLQTINDQNFVSNITKEAISL